MSPEGVTHPLATGILAAMSYRTKRPTTRSLLVFGVGATFAISQLGAGCVPASRYRPCEGRDAAVVDPNAQCVPNPPGQGAHEGDAGK